MSHDVTDETHGGAFAPVLRKLGIGTARFTEIEVQDKPGEDGACHVYHIKSVPVTDVEPVVLYGQIQFQNEPIKENGINGCHQEDLIAIVIDRLQHFQAGELCCRENALALTKLEEAMHWLNHRTAERHWRGVEGTNQL